MSERGKRWDWMLIASSTLFSTLAFNLTFFLQEFFLVVPKALTPGVHATLYHNNHGWTGGGPLVELLQGTGALADLASGLLFCALLAKSAGRALGWRLFLFWMAFQGIYQALSQVVLGALLPGNDVARAMAYLGFGAGAKSVAALVALAAMIGAGIWLMRQFIAAIAIAAETQCGGARMGIVFRAATLPALLSVILLIPFREPRNIVEVAILPLIVMISGMLWIQASAWFGPRAERTTRPAPPLAWPATALLIVLALFQLVLRPGIAFS